MPFTKPTETQIREALLRYAPALADTPIAFLGEGWSFWAFTADDHVLRFPKEEASIAPLTMERLLLSELTHLLCAARTRQKASWVSELGASTKTEDGRIFACADAAELASQVEVEAAPASVWPLFSVGDGLSHHGAQLLGAVAYVVWQRKEDARLVVQLRHGALRA